MVSVDLVGALVPWSRFEHSALVEKVELLGETLILGLNGLFLNLFLFYLIYYTSFIRSSC